MNDRAQKIRMKRLNERRDPTLEIHSKATKLFEWVLDLLENPTPYNTGDKVTLVCGHNNCIVLSGDRKSKKFKKLVFEPEVIKELVKMFESEEGYNAAYLPKSSVYLNQECIIKIE